MRANTVENVNDLLVERLFKDFDTVRLINWAKAVQKEGFSSENLDALAAGDYRSKEEAEKYFLNGISDLNLEIPETEAKQIRIYARKVAQDVLKRGFSVENGFLTMLKLAGISAQEIKIYNGFTEIEEDLENLYLGKPANRQGLNLLNQRNYILEEFKLFSAMESLNIPDKARFQEYCKVCGKLSVPTLKTKYQIRRPFRYVTLSCENCKSEQLRSSSDHFVKRKIIESFLD